MEKINQLLDDKEYQKQLEQLEQLEKQRPYCKHGIEHLLAVARIAQLRNQQEKWQLEEESIYLAALLHDIGRIEEYEKGIPHHVAGIQKAAYFLEKLNVPKEQKLQILEAISTHRQKQEEFRENRLGRLLAQADSASRNCRFCKAYQTCKWKEEKKNRKLLH